MRIGGWKTPSMFRRYNVVDERDLTEAAERLAGFLADASSAPPTIVPLARSTPPMGVLLREHGQNTDNRGTSAVAAVGSTTVSSRTWRRKRPGGLTGLQMRRWGSRAIP
jgi:hypothetical protein